MIICLGDGHQPGCQAQYPIYHHREAWGVQRCQSCGKPKALSHLNETYRRVADGRRVGSCCNPWHGGVDRTGQRVSRRGVKGRQRQAQARRRARG